MRVAGKRLAPEVTMVASAELLSLGGVFNDAIHKLPSGETTFFPKGIYRYATHAEANQHWDDSVTQGIAKYAGR